MNSYGWIKKVKEKEGLTSDYQAAKILGLTKQSISNHKKKINISLDDQAAYKVAKLLNLDPLYVIADQHAEREQDKKLKNIWLKLAGSAASFLLALPLLGAYVGYYVK